MREDCRLTGVVLQAQPVGEYDRRCVILTRERGRITAFARGARRATSPFLAATNPFVFARFTLYEGRDAYTFAGAEVIDYFTELAQVQPGVWYGFYFLELASYYGQEGMEAYGMVDLLYTALRALKRESLPPKLIRRIFECRMMGENGDFAPPEEPGDLDPGAFYALGYASGAPFARLFAFSLSETSMEAFAEAVENGRRRAVDRTLKSLAVIEELGE